MPAGTHCQGRVADRVALGTLLIAAACGLWDPPAGGAPKPPSRRGNRRGITGSPGPRAAFATGAGPHP